MSFKSREDSHETHYAHDEDVKFRVRARRDKLFGRWVAEQLGNTGDEAERYARELVHIDLEHPGDDEMLGKVRTDLANAGTGISDALIERRLEEYTGRAREQIMNQG